MICFCHLFAFAVKIARELKLESVMQAVSTRLLGIVTLRSLKTGFRACGDALCLTSRDGHLLLRFHSIEFKTKACLCQGGDRPFMGD